MTAKLTHAKSQQVCFSYDNNYYYLLYVLYIFFNNTGTEVNWVQCEECNKWYHYVCVGLNKKAVQKLARYECFRCNAEEIKEEAEDNNSNTSMDGVSKLLSMINDQL